MGLSVKINILIFLLFFFSACEKKTEAKEENIFNYNKVEVLSEENNPIPKKLYSLPIVNI